MTDESILRLLWEVKHEKPFSQISINKIEGFNRDDYKRAQQLLHDFADQSGCPVDGLRITRVASGVFKLIKINPQSDSSAIPKGTSLPNPQKTLTGENLPSTTDFLPSVPAELKALRQWVVWREEKRDDKPTKVPYQITGKHAQANNPETWTDFNAAAQHRERFAGVGFVFSESDPYCGIDLDNCIEEAGNIKPWAQPIVEELKGVGYGEVSPSGRGMKFWTRAALSATASHRRGIEDGEIEIYDRGRYFTATGRGGGGISDGQATVDWLCDTYLAKPKTDKRSSSSPPISRTATVDEVVQQIQQSRQSAKFNALMDGNTAGYGSQSEADLALCSVVVFWTQDPNTLDAIFRQSRLMRNKWDERHRADGATYGQMTIEKAIAECHDVYTPKKRTSARNKRGYRRRTASARRNL